MRHFLAILLLLSPALASDTLPNAPSATPRPNLFRRLTTPDEGPIHPFRERKFKAAFAYMVLANIYDNEVTHQGLANHRCAEHNWLDFGSISPYHVSRWQLYRESVIIVPAITGLAWAIRKGGWRYVGEAMMVTNGTIHWQAGTAWFTQGCY